MAVKTKGPGHGVLIEEEPEPNENQVKVACSISPLYLGGSPPLALSLSLCRTAVGKSLPFNEPMRKPALHQLFCFCSCLLLFLCYCYCHCLLAMPHTYTQTHTLARTPHTPTVRNTHRPSHVAQSQFFSLRLLHTDVVKSIEAPNFNFN